MHFNRQPPIATESTKAGDREGRGKDRGGLGQFPFHETEKERG